MGYTTEFEGQFTFTSPLPPEVATRIKAVHDSEDEPDSPGGYCQWELTGDGTGLRWDGGEKFYDYDDWLQWIVDTILAPAGVGLSGSVQYQGESIGDFGVLTVVDGKVAKRKTKQVADDTEELRAFREFVLNHDGWTDTDMQADWQRRKKSLSSGGGKKP